MREAVFLVVIQCRHSDERGGIFGRKTTKAFASILCWADVFSPKTGSLLGQNWTLHSLCTYFDSYWTKSSTVCSLCVIFTKLTIANCQNLLCLNNWFINRFFSLLLTVRIVCVFVCLDSVYSSRGSIEGIPSLHFAVYIMAGATPPTFHFNNGGLPRVLDEGILGPGTPRVLGPGSNVDRHRVLKKNWMFKDIAHVSET